MAKPNSQYEKLVRDAAERLERARDLGDQLTFLPDEGETPADQGGDGKVGRPEGAKNKGSSQMREYLAARGYAMPEEVIAQMAGITGGASGDAIEHAMRQTERVLTWAADGAAKQKRKGGSVDDWIPTGGQRLETFKAIFTIQLRAAEALLPYGTPKASPDVQVKQSTTIIMPGAKPADPAASARDITPPQGAIENRPAWQQEIIRKQQVSDPSEAHSDAKTRTDKASD